jgi:hypothetical protein
MTFHRRFTPRPGPARVAAFGSLSAGIISLLTLVLFHGHGRRAHAHGRSEPVVPDRAAVEKLQSVGYSAWSDRGASTAKSGVVHYEPERSAQGYNLYTDYTDAAYLIDMRGRLVHEWRFPSGEGISREFARMLPDGSLLSHGPYLVKQTWDSVESWRQPPQVGDAFTHDLEILDDGSFVIPSTKGVLYNGYHVNMEYVEHFTADMKLHCSWSSLKSLAQLHRFHPPTIFDVKGRTVDSTDYYHANTIRILPDTPLGRRDSRFRKGNWMICLRQVSLVAIIDQASHDVVWGWGPRVLDHPHSPVMMPDGQILVFDNGMMRGYSRLVRMDPRTRAITWTYEGSPRDSFFSSERGFIQPLPNGNLQVTLSGKGRALEMTMDGHLVWDFLHPEMQGDERRAIYRMIRYPASIVDALLAKDPPARTANR